jgi:hypothetical protein
MVRSNPPLVQRRIRGQRRLRLRREAAWRTEMVDEDESDIGQFQNTLAARLWMGGLRQGHDCFRRTLQMSAEAAVDQNQSQEK